MPFSGLATPSATQEVLAAHGLATKKRLGQHFLIDDNTVGRILAFAALTGDEVALEVGPGIGTLTIALCTKAGAVVAVERDRDLLPVLEETTAVCPRISLIRADALEVSPDDLARPFGEPTTLVANLPYSVAATLVLHFFEVLPSLASAVVMVQAEVADRISALPGGKDYGAYTVKLRLLAQTTGRFRVPRTCFLPPPRVDSAVVRLQRHPLDEDPERRSLAAAAADAAFAHRRKTVRNSLKTSLHADPALLEDALMRAGVRGDDRAERLSPATFLALGESLNSAHLLRF
jgi:16S rRNA (adenine1518-N6/adenine1519-N6)-dimethyltransferase